MTAGNDLQQALYIEQGNPEPAVTVERRANGEIILCSPYPCGPLPRSGVHVLLERAEEFPDRVLIAERQGDGWQHLIYAEAVAGMWPSGCSTRMPLSSGLWRFSPAVLSNTSRWPGGRCLPVYLMCQ